MTFEEKVTMETLKEASKLIKENDTTPCTCPKIPKGKIMIGAHYCYKCGLLTLGEDLIKELKRLGL